MKTVTLAAVLLLGMVGVAPAAQEGRCFDVGLGGVLHIESPGDYNKGFKGAFGGSPGQIQKNGGVAGIGTSANEVAEFRNEGQKTICPPPGRVQ